MAAESIQTPFALRRNQDIVLAVCVIAIMLVLVIPIPTMLLDLLLTLNISLSVVVLLTSIYLQRPIEFAVFPVAAAHPHAVPLELKRGVHAIDPRRRQRRPGDQLVRRFRYPW